MNIRNSAKAIILQDNKLLVIKKEDTEGSYFILLLQDMFSFNLL